MENPIKIVVADDDAFVRAGVRLYLEPVVEKIKIIGYATDGAETINAVKSLQPNILLLDLQMPKMIDPWKAIEQFDRLQPNLKIIVLSAHEDIDYVSKALAAGARGYLTKSSLEQELRWSIQLVANGYSAIKYELLAQTLSVKRLSAAVTPTSYVKHSTKPQKLRFLSLAWVDKLLLTLLKRMQSHFFNKKNRQKLIKTKQQINETFINISQLKFTLRPVHIIIFFCCSLSLTILISAMIIALR